jgi:hypothetical protein
LPIADLFSWAAYIVSQMGNWQSEIDNTTALTAINKQ